MLKYLLVYFFIEFFFMVYNIYIYIYIYIYTDKQECILHSNSSLNADTQSAEAVAYVDYTFPVALGNVKYLFIGIIPRSTLTQIGITCKGPIFRSNRTI